MEIEQAKKIIEVILYMTDHPLTIKEILEILESKKLTDQDVKAYIGELRDQLDKSGSALQIVDVAGGVQMATRPEMSFWVRKLFKERLTVRLSPSALETLSIIAYKQPIARAEIEQIRGVEVTGVAETLLERRLIRVVGRKETIGRPRLYGTTPEFLRLFGLKHLTDLPDIDTFSKTEAEPPKEEPVQEELISADL